MRRSVTSVTLAVLAVGVLAGCGADPRTGGAGSDNSGTGSTITVAGTGDPAAAPEALRFEAPLVGGGALDFRELQGTTVALWFWAPT